MRRWAWFLLALATTTASARLTIFAWDDNPSWPAGTTVDLCSNGVCASGITDTQHTLDVPIEPGERFDARARTVTVDGQESEWTTLVQTWPALPVGLWAYELHEGPIVASYSDNFDRADGDIGASWIEDAGDHNIVSNVAAAQTVDILNRARYASEMASSNHQVIATVTRLGGITARQASSTQTFYRASIDAYDNSGGYKIRKYVDGSETILGSASNLVESGAIRITLIVDGSTIKMLARVFSGGWQDDVEVLSVTDTSITTGTYVGIASQSNIATYNDWSAEDLAGVVQATALPRRALDGPLFGALRGSVR